VFTALLPVVAVPTAGAAAVPPIPSPATVLSVSPFNGTMSTELQGAVCQSPNTCTPVIYVPFIDSTGVAALQNAITTTSAGKIIVFGYSDGAAVTQAWLAQHLNDPNAPSPQVLSFVVIGNPTRAFGGLNVATGGPIWPQSEYQVIDIAQQYDAIGDYPNNTASPYYLLAVINAWLGFLSKPHLDYTQVNINDPANAVWTVGNITYVLTPTPDLPILLGFAPLFPAFAAQLQAGIETAYIRPVPFPTTQPAAPATSPAAASALSTSVVSDPTVAPEPTTVPVSLAPAATAPRPGVSPTATGPTNTNSSDTIPAAVDTTAAPTLPDAANVAGTVKTITAPAAKPTLDNAIVATQSTTATNHTAATSSTNGNPAPTGKSNSTQGKTGKNIETRGETASTSPRSSKAK
jgi:pimeloyl-ACP methyl ester carboxylesterase